MNKPISDYGDKMKLSQFVYDCMQGNFIDYDGHGYYSDGETMTDIKVFPSDIMNENVNYKYDYVIWFNR